MNKEERKASSFAEGSFGREENALSEHEKTARSMGENAFRGGSYSLLLSVLVLAILIAVNVLVSALPDSMTRFDISASKLYSITGNTRVVVNALTEDVTIHWIVQAGEEDEVIENLLGKYEGLSGHIKVEKKNPDIYPTFAEQYTEEPVLNNSLVVTCGDRSRYISYDDMYLQEADMYSYSYNTSFDGEGAITSAIDYVVTEELPKLYLLTGHGEAELPGTFAEQIEKENIETESLSLPGIDELPEDADCILIYAPQSDLSAEDAEMLSSYADAGGKLLVMAGPLQEGLPENLYGILASHGVLAAEGIIVEEERARYAFRAPYVLIPDMEEHEITSSLIEENYLPIMPLSAGLTVEEAAENVTVLLESSDTAYAKADGFALETYEREEGDTDGPFASAVSIETENGGEIVWFASSEFLADLYNAYSSGANGDMAMNALSSLIGEREAMAIRSKSLNYHYLTISESAASALKVLMIGVCPLLYLGTGIYVTVRRRRKQYEPV